jgi:predicted P-loop ATPase
VSNVIDLRARQSGKDRLLNIATGASVSSNRVKNQRLTWAQMVEKFGAPTKTRETIKEYLAMPREAQDKIKDQGYFVPAHYEGNVRKKENLGLKDLGTLDYDHAGTNFLEEIKETFDGYEFVLYTTHKHTAEKPRFRVVLLFSRPVDDAEYQAAMRKVAAMGCIDDTDDTTFQPSRVMHFGSHALDGEFVFEHVTGRMLDVDALLATYNDWKDISQWPVSSRVSTPLRQSGRKAQDPRDKVGIIGAWCKTYDIEAAIDKYLPGSYVAGSSPNRLTYSGSTASNGAVLYDEGQFLYSNHESDPCGGKNVNSWDLVRLHLYGELDSKQREDTAPSKLKSYEAMVLLAKDDPDVKGALLAERLHIEDDFEGFDTEGDSPDAVRPAPDSSDGSQASTAASSGEAHKELKAQRHAELKAQLQKIVGKLRTNNFGNVQPILFNLQIIFDNDPQLVGSLAFNEFRNDVVLMKKLPGLREAIKKDGSEWTDTAELMVKVFIEKRYEVTFPTATIKEGSLVISQQHRFHPVREYMRGLIWDGVSRVDTLFVDYFGAEDSPYTRAVTRKWLCAGVARVFTPGIKYDHAIVLESAEGIGKSSLARELAKGWFTDDLTLDLDSDQVVEKTRDVLIAELPEMIHRTAEVEAVKAFISRTTEKVRLAFKHNVGVFPRQFILIGTTNATEYLRSETGNRRIHPIKGDGREIDIAKLRANVDQIWAEAYDLRINYCEPLYLENPDIVAAATAHQAKRVEIDEWASVISNWLDALPDADFDGTRNVRRDRTTSMQIWAECLKGDVSKSNQSISRRITNIMRKMPGWTSRETVRLGNGYAPARGFVRVS